MRRQFSKKIWRKKEQALLLKIFTQIGWKINSKDRRTYPLSPRIMTLRSIRLREAIDDDKLIDRSEKIKRTKKKLLIEIWNFGEREREILPPDSAEAKSQTTNGILNRECLCNQRSTRGQTARIALFAPILFSFPLDLVHPIKIFSDFYFCSEYHIYSQTTPSSTPKWTVTL